MFLGCGRSEMVFPEGFFPTEGFVQQVHPLYVRALRIGQENPVVLVSVEMTSLPDEETAELRKVAAACAGTEAANVWVAATHTFSAPHIMPDGALRSEEDRARKVMLQSLLRNAVRDAVEMARKSAEEAELTLRQGQSEVLASRDIELKEGWWIGCGGTGPSDKTLTVLKIQAGDAMKGLLLHLNVQSSVLDGTGSAGGKCVSGDLAGVACAALERRFPGATVMFMVGAAGDQAPVRRARGYAPNGEGGYAEIDLRQEGVAIAEALGNQLAEETLAVLNQAGERIEGDAGVRSRSFDVPSKKMNRNLHELRPTRACEWEQDGIKEQTIELLIIGDLGILGVKPELTFPTARRILASSPFAHTLIATMVNGAAKYMADRSAYDRCMYEAVNSPFAPGAAEYLEAEAKKLFDH